MCRLSSAKWRIERRLDPQGDASFRMAFTRSVLTDPSRAIRWTGKISRRETSLCHIRHRTRPKGAVCTIIDHRNDVVRKTAPPPDPFASFSLSLSYYILCLSILFSFLFYVYNIYSDKENETSMHRMSSSSSLRRYNHPLPPINLLNFFSSFFMYIVYIKTFSRRNTDPTKYPPCGD